MRRLGLLLALIALVATDAGCRKYVFVPPPVAWRHDLDAALADAKTQNKPVVLFFSADWDTTTSMMNRKTFGDPNVRRLLGGFVSIAIDCTDDEDRVTREASRRFMVVGLVTVIVLSPDLSTELVRINSYVEGPEFAAALRGATRKLKELKEADVSPSPRP